MKRGIQEVDVFSNKKVQPTKYQQGRSLYKTFLLSLKLIFKSENLNFYKSTRPDPDRQESHIF